MAVKLCGILDMKNNLLHSHSKCRTTKFYIILGGNIMRIHITKKQKKPFIILLIFLAIYIGLSTLIGFPLGFGTMMARGIAKDHLHVKSTL